MASAATLKARTKHYFSAHGRFCASHPWEVIVTIVTLTVCVLSMSVLSGGKVGTVCGVSKPCKAKPEDEQVADTVLLSIVNSLAVIYIYNQFASLRKAGSKYLLGIAGLFTIFASFVFGSGVVNLIDEKVSGLNEALPFFLLLIDLSKASALAKFAFKSRTKEEVRENIGRGMSVLGPNMTLDTLVEVLLIGIGTISGVRQLEMICCFGCMSIMANYLVFMTFFPASLALVLEVCPYNPSNPLDKLARDMQEEERKPNPVVQRVKVIMALGLFAVHLHSRFFSTVTGLSFGLGPAEDEGSSLGREGEEKSSDIGEGEIEKVPLQEYLWWKVFNLSVDQLITITLAAVLFVKYIFFDKSKTFDSSVPPTPTHSRHNSHSLDKRLPSSHASLSCTLPRLSNSFHFPESRCPLANGHFQPEELTRLLSQGAVITDETNLTPLALPSVEKDSKEKAVTKLQTELREPSPLPEKYTVDTSVAPLCVSVSTQTECEDEVQVVPRVTWNDGEEDEEEEERSTSPEEDPIAPALPPRPLEECLTIFRSDSGAASLTDEEILQLVAGKHIPAYKLESALGDPERGVAVRRKLITRQLNSGSNLDNLPFSGYDYSLVMGACCENVIGYLPVPVGVAGPLLLDGVPYYVPMATTEGTLVASTNRGCRAVASSGGVKSYIIGDGMTRGPVVRLPSAAEASALKVWLDDHQNFASLEGEFSSTSRFAKLKSLQTAIAGRLVYIRFKATTGDAMGMNMLSKGVERVLQFVKTKFPEMDVISLSGNFCTDKKPAAINWLEGRGKSVVCEAVIPAQVVKQVLKTSVDALVDLNISKNLVGSAMAGSVGGFNAHAANIVSAIFIATGQDPAQNVASSNCITLMEHSGVKGEDLYMSCTMPSVEIGTIGGGTILLPQATCLKMLGVQGAHHNKPGENATQLARIVCGTVLAGELSLLSALAAGHLVRSHLTHNRSNLNLASIPEIPPTSEPKRTNSIAT